MNRTLPGGFLIAIEGIDGAGKSLQAQAVAASLQQRGLACVTTREPTHGPWGQRLRESAAKGRLAPADELHAFLEDRKQHVAELIRPSLAAGNIVLTDRYYFSTVAYQGARGFEPADLLRLNEAIAVEPDLLIVIDLPPEVGLARVGHRDGATNEFETLTQLRRSREIFLSLQKPYLVCVDGTLPPREIHDRILVALSLAAVQRFCADPQLSPRQKLAACLTLHGGPTLED